MGISVVWSGKRLGSVVEQNTGLPKGGPHPTLLYGYGAYGVCVDPGFDVTRLPLLDRGVVFAIAHVRGGGELGRHWYEKGGKYLQKRNTFSDTVACAERLIELNLTQPAKLGLEGRSAGGLLVGAVLNMRPDLFKAAIAGVPFVDCLTTMCDSSIPLTTGEWEEWGNPNEKKFFDYMRSYSPMDNVIPQRYPSILALSGLHDPRVAFWEPAKWVQLLRSAERDARKMEQEHENEPVTAGETSEGEGGNFTTVVERVEEMPKTFDDDKNNPEGDIILKTDLDVGHFSASDRYKYLKETAFANAFLLDRLGVTG